jgi:hypothetical protein
MLLKKSNFTLKQFYLVLLILSSGMGMSIFRATWYPLISLIFGLVVVIKYDINLSKKRFLKILLLWFVYFVIVSLKFKSFHPRFMVEMPILFFTAFVIFSIFNLKSFIRNYENIIFRLSLISLVFFIWQIVSRLSLISLFSSIDFNSGDSINFIVYTIHHRAVDNFFARNSGFCWEPGPFSSFVVIALFFRFLQNGVKFDKRTFVYTLTIVSTYSSVGLLSLLVVVLWYYYVNNKVYFKYLLPIYLFGIYLVFFNVTFLGYKIFSQAILAQDEINFYTKYGGNADGVSIGRFSGFLLNIEDLRNNPIFGFGGNFASTISSTNDLLISSTTGLGNWLSQFGFVGIVFFLYAWYRTSNFILLSFNCRGGIFFFVVILIIFFGFKLNYYPFFITLMLMFFFSEEPQKFKKF